MEIVKPRHHMKDQGYEDWRSMILQGFFLRQYKVKKIHFKFPRKNDRKSKHSHIRGCLIGHLAWSMHHYTWDNVCHYLMRTLRPRYAQLHFFYGLKSLFAYFRRWISGKSPIFFS